MSSTKAGDRHGGREVISVGIQFVGQYRLHDSIVLHRRDIDSYSL